MFTGIIQNCVSVRALLQIAEQSYRLELENPFASVPDTVQPGESIATNGVCLTVTDFSREHLAFDLAPETVRVTAL
ncbi:riboflavin synthase, partial [bacterium]|nr:riboflavin synthase [bacterium]